MTELSADRVQEVSASAGTGAIVLGGAASPSLRTFSQAFADGSLVAYVILNQAVLSEWERGIGTYNATMNEIVRTYVTGGSNGTSRVNFSAGTKSVLSAPPPTSAGSAWSATQVYAPGDTATSSGTTWYCLSVNLNSAPSSGNANWSAMGGGGITTPVSIANGGTGQTTATAALIALGGAPVNNPTFNGTLITQNGGSNGYLALVSGTGAHTGYVAFYSPTGVRQGYIGYNDGTNLSINCESTNLLVTAATSAFSGAITSGSGTNFAGVVRCTDGGGATIVGAGSGTELEWSGTSGYVTAYDRTNSNYLPLAVRGSTISLKINGSDAVVVGTDKRMATNGVSFGSVVASSATNLSKHIDLYGGSYGFCVTSSTLNYVSNGTHKFNSTVTAPSVTDTSDKRIKSNVQAMSIKDARRIVTETKCVRFDNDLTHRPDFGVIADDQINVTPELVMTPEDPDDMKSMNYQRLVAPLCQVATDLMGQVDKLKRELAMLRAHVDDMRMH